MGRSCRINALEYLARVGTIEEWSESVKTSTLLQT